MLLDRIENPQDLKKLKIGELNLLCDEIRETLLKRLSEFGGHIGSNLGVVEMTIALHYVFCAPKDKIIFDVSHQCYTHKMLTGRKLNFIDSEKYNEISGFSSPEESEYDLFKMGHTSTSISLASGLIKARDIKKEKYNVIAVIGDGSLSGGEAYEGLNNIIENGSNAIIIVNDNEMAISENCGGLYKNLQNLRISDGNFEPNFFEALGYKYYYLNDGNNIEKLVKLFSQVKDTTSPVILHIHTEKGKGFEFALKDKEKWHFGGPFDKKNGEFRVTNGEMSYNEFNAQLLLSEIKKNKNLVIINAGSPSAIGFDKGRRIEAGEQFVNVGIAEEHAIAMASGLVKNGCKAVFGVYSSFLQRGYDQISQELCLNNNPAVILVVGGSIYGTKDATHLGLFDIPLLSNIPNLVYLAPTNAEEYASMFRYAINQNEHPIAIKVPSGFVEHNEEDNTDYSRHNISQVVQRGKEVAIFGLGNFLKKGREVVEELCKKGINATLINPKFISGVDENLLLELMKDHKLVITLEDGVLDGGYGQKIASFYSDKDIAVKCFGIKKSFPDRYDENQLMRENGLLTEQIVEYILNFLKKSKIK